MKRPDHKHVRDVAFDLLAMRNDRAVERPAPVYLPSAGVSARLAIIWAMQQDSGLMCGVLESKAPERVAHIRELVSVGVEAWEEELDLLELVILPVRCGRATHTVMLQVDSSFATPSHRDLDVEAEQVAAAFGTPLLPCIVEIDAATQRPLVPGAPTRLREKALLAGELFWFALLCRTWLEKGFALSHASPAIDRGLPYASLAGYLDKGLDVAEAVTWMDVTPGEATDWRSLTFTPTDRRTWVSQGRTIDDARRAMTVSGGSERVQRWARVIGPHVTPEVIGEWARWGEPLSIWGEVASRGLLPQEVDDWRSVLNPVEIVGYVQHRVPLDVAMQWKDAGYSCYVALGFMELGISLADALAMRRHPARQVQQLWPRHQSVAGVMAELDRAEAVGRSA